MEKFLFKANSKHVRATSVCFVEVPLSMKSNWTCISPEGYKKVKWVQEVSRGFKKAYDGKIANELGL